MDENQKRKYYYGAIYMIEEVLYTVQQQIKSNYGLCVEMNLDERQAIVIGICELLEMSGIDKDIVDNVRENFLSDDWDIHSYIPF